MSRHLKRRDWVPGSPFEFKSQYRGGVVGKDASGRRIWGCANCGKTGHWAPSWSYYGSLLHEAGEEVVEATACSVDCMHALATLNGWPKPKEAQR